VTARHLGRHGDLYGASRSGPLSSPAGAVAMDRTVGAERGQTAWRADMSCRQNIERVMLGLRSWPVRCGQAATGCT